MSNQQSPFRVIVIGAGVAGLTASHCLQRAGINHVVLEKHREAVPTEGASITIYPQVVRILHQIGCGEAIIKASVPHDQLVTRRPDGSVLGSTPFFGFVKENHGADLLPLERREFLQILYDNLPDKTPIKTSRIIKDIKESRDGVEVVMSDGTVEKGDIVLGVDGVYSMVRNIMWHHANKATPGLITEKEKSSFKTHWKCLVGIGPPEPSLGASDLTVTHDTRYSFEIVAQPHCTFFFVYFYLDKPFQSPNRVHYSDQDAEALAASVADHPLTETCTFGHLWNNRVRSTLVSSEEGVLDHWYHGRIVLAGDAIHKMTPNIALGGNAAIESVVSLCNHLHRTLATQGKAKPSLAALTDAFAGYQAERMERVKYAIKISGIATRIQAMTTPLYRFLAWVTPLLPERGAPDQVGEYIRGSPKIEYLSSKGLPQGRLRWKDEEDEEKRIQLAALGKLDTKTKQVLKAGHLMQMMSVSVAVVMLVSAARYVPFVNEYTVPQLLSWVKV
ncbi:FAD binding domain protein [Hypoxylon rubiginosum]|uniref:FAD binding domain protein n=1 Tax=Hypoxylon rubiginosum TaxID=110542 RepID=A0ACC0D1F1_9PEZI|nr:FAD binding domain protein [Hypoxylon rubiginosum]